MFNVFKSLVITLIISTGLGFSFREHFGFWETFVVVTIVQFLVSFLYKSKKIQNDNNLIQDLTNTIDELIEKQQVLVECPCGKNTISTIVFLNEETVLECDKCNNTFKIVPEIQTQLVTEPLNMEGIYNKLKEQQYNKV